MVKCKQANKNYQKKLTWLIDFSFFIVLFSSQSIDRSIDCCILKSKKKNQKSDTFQTHKNWFLSLTLILIDCVNVDNDDSTQRLFCFQRYDWRNKMKFLKKIQVYIVIQKKTKKHIQLTHAAAWWCHHSFDLILWIWRLCIHIFFFGGFNQSMLFAISIHNDDDAWLRHFFRKFKFLKLIFQLRILETFHHQHWIHHKHN